ncbi:thymidylate synthase [Aurantiacibacter gangjinensis]|uniref:Uncharacterized protein n=1 Tax=Aurantiacibacter gangjinensis TaxID=502682 RepID=A0A0G9MMR1_9SPHN|nr:thymidylate synthase [Aurantiacibacter gangjinensis]APE28056.1 Thymidylate synthase [Aurantiacibacter gangjinensis]KLE31980.1 hypothetical protein AAW01_11135 [Aurantiacibacter gangjinensis]
MEFRADGLDDLLAQLYPFILETGVENVGSKGRHLDTIGTTLRLTDPRARLSRSMRRAKPFSAIGELLWYLSGTDEASFMDPYHRYYSQDGAPSEVADAYGPRLRGRLPEKGFDYDQLQFVLETLREKPGSRRAIIQIYDSADRTLERDVPCTTTLQFHGRGDQLHMTTTMRSNDAYIGLPHDLFCFTMLQEMVATRLRLGLGEYVHFAGSMHIYESNLAAARGYLHEGYHRIAPMPAMPAGDPFEAFAKLMQVETRIRDGDAVDFDGLGFDSYYEDIARLVLVNFRSDDAGEVTRAMRGLTHREYHTYMDDRDGVVPVGKRETVAR